MPRSSTAFTFTGARPASAAAARPARTSGSRSRRASSLKACRDKVSRDTFSRFSPAGRHAAAITTATRTWRQLPVLPPGTATLAPAPSAGWDALAVHGTRLTIWQAAPGARAWSSAQVIKVPIPFGSSG